MRKALSASTVVFCALLVLGLAGLPAYGQDNDKTKEHPNGIVHDWSNHHVVFPLYGEIHSLIKVQNDPRAIQSWQEALRRDWNWDHNRIQPSARSASIHRDWAIGLGTGNMAASMYPAKFGFNPSGTSSCIIGSGVPTPDFIVFTVNVAGSATQPNIVAFQDLYSGTAGGTGLCDGERPTYFTGDTPASAATFWSYNVHAADGVVATSPALSIDGTKIAFVEKGAGTNAHFHVLAYNGGTASVAGDGVTISNSQTVTNPKTITSFASLAPVAGSGTATDLSLGAASDTLSSPFVDYVHDYAYVGNDTGTLFRITNVFCALSTCTPGTSAAPALDINWGSDGALATGCTGKLTGPVVDGSGNVLVGCSDGKLYGFTNTGGALPGSPLTVGDGTALGGIVDPPLVDTVNGFVYVATASATGTGFPVVVQTGASSFTTTSIATLGATAAGFNLHAPAFNNAYFTSGTSTSWLLYEYSNSTSGASFTFWGIPFNGSHQMTAGTPGDADAVTLFGTTEISPLTEFANGANDWIFASSLTSSSTDNFVNWNVAGGFPGDPTSFVSEGAGSTGIVIDNSGTDPQESSAYFGTLAGGSNPNQNDAVKVTQNGLN